MGLSNDLISEFVKATNDSRKSNVENSVFGKVVEYNNTAYVKLDGSELLTPISTTTDVHDGERVMVTIKNHTAIITGNISSPSTNLQTELDNGDGTTTKLSDVGGNIQAADSKADEATSKADEANANISDLDDQVASDIKGLNTSLGDLSEKVDTNNKEIQDKIAEFQSTINGWSFDWSKIVNGEETLTDYIRFVDGDIILGKVDSGITLRISNDRISFLQNEIEVAYISDNKLKIPQMSVLETENDIMEMAGFKYYKRSNGNLSFNIM